MLFRDKKILSRLTGLSIDISRNKDVSKELRIAVTQLAEELVRLQKLVRPTDLENLATEMIKGLDVLDFTDQITGVIDHEKRIKRAYELARLWIAERDKVTP